MSYRKGVFIMISISEYIELLRKKPSSNLFNPWWEKDEVNDDYSNSAEIRRRQLKCYLEERKNNTKYLLVGEALGYQGGHFTGIAMTSERILLGKMKHKNIEPDFVFKTIEPMRTSKESVKYDGFTEPTATIVWTHLLSLGLDPYSFVLWNAVPWHPYKANKPYLSNRTPTDLEMKSGLTKLKILISILNPSKTIAVGEKAAQQLRKAKINHTKVRHPANGGATKFREQFKKLYDEYND